MSPSQLAPASASPTRSADVAWLGEAYDSFADGLYAYCRSLVREPAAAADAVRDTFVVTAFRLDELPGEGLLRPWLYAVARNECLRAISNGQAAAAVEFLLNEAGTDSGPAVLPSGEEAAPAAPMRPARTSTAATPGKSYGAASGRPRRPGPRGS